MTQEEQIHKISVLLGKIARAKRNLKRFIGELNELSHELSEMEDILGGNNGPYGVVYATRETNEIEI